MILGTITKTGTLNKITCNCPKCGQNEEFTFQITTKFFHFLRLRCFPFEKSEICQCNNCQTIYNASNFTTEMRLLVRELRKREKNTFFNYLGLVAIFCIIVWFNLPQSESEKKRIKELNDGIKKEFVAKIQNPKYNDVYYLQKKDTIINNQEFAPTSFLVVKEITKDSLTFNLCKYEELAEKNGKVTIREGFKKQYYDSSNLFHSKIRIDRKQILKDTTISNFKIYNIDREEVTK